MDESTGSPAGASEGRDALPWGAVRVRLRALCDVALDSVPADGAAVSAMSGPGHSALIHATDQVAAQLDELQFALGEGPSRVAFRGGYPVLAANLAGTSGEEPAARWPSFARAATALGASAAYAMPLQVGVIKLGALLLYRTVPGPLAAAGLGEALRFADAITYAVIDAMQPAPGDVSTSAMSDTGTWPGSGTANGEVRHHLDMAHEGYRAVVHQAAGMVAHQLGIGVDEALARLRAAAYAEGASLTDFARAVVERKLRLQT